MAGTLRLSYITSCHLQGWWGWKDPFWSSWTRVSSQGVAGFCVVSTHMWICLHSFYAPFPRQTALPVPFVAVPYTCKVSFAVETKELINCHIFMFLRSLITVVSEVGIHLITLDMINLALNIWASQPGLLLWLMEIGLPAGNYSSDLC